MPHMMPMLWMLTFILSLLFFFSLISLLYFFYVPNLSYKNPKFFKSKKWIWSW